MEKVRPAYSDLSEKERESLCSNSLTKEQMVSIVETFQKYDLNLSEVSSELERCIFDEMIEKNQVKRVKVQKNVLEMNRSGFIYTRKDNVEGDLFSPIGIISIADSVGGDQFASLGVAFNYADSVGGDQFAGLGVAFNYADNVGRDQFAGLGAINIAKEVMGSQYAFTSCAINIAKRVGKNQFGLVNIATEEIKGKQIGIVNYADGDKYKQYGLLNFRPGKRRWNPEVSLFYHDAEKREKIKAEKELKRIALGLEERVKESRVRIEEQGVQTTAEEEMIMEEEEELFTDEKTKSDLF